MCGGLQMLGRSIHDPNGSEGEPGSSEGLGYLDYETTLLKKADKKLRRVAGYMNLPGKPACTGYEIHSGDTVGKAVQHHAVELDQRVDGAIGADGQILTTYLHGIFDQQAACAALLEWAGMKNAQAIDYVAERERHIDRWADIVEQHLNLDLLNSLIEHH